MAHHIGVHHHLSLVHAAIWAQFDDDEFVRYVRSIEQLGPFPAPFRLLLTIDGASTLNLTVALLRDQSNRAPQFSSYASRVIVAPAELAFGLSRMFSMLAPTASDQYCVVKTIDEAAAILGISLNELPTT